MCVVFFLNRCGNVGFHSGFPNSCQKTIQNSTQTACNVANGNAKRKYAHVSKKYLRFGNVVGFLTALVVEYAYIWRR
jgi:hypothetical protein